MSELRKLQEGIDKIRIFQKTLEKQVGMINENVFPKQSQEKLFQSN